MNHLELKIVINSSTDKIWDVLVNQYGDIHIHNPNMQASHNIDGATHGALNCVRYCEFNDKLNLEEKISAVEEGVSCSMEVTKHNLPFAKEMSATYTLKPINANKTELTMMSNTSTSPSFMIYLMRGVMAKALDKHLFGMKYFIETGKTVSADNYKEVYKGYNK